MVLLHVNSRHVGMLKLFSFNICSVNGELVTLVNIARSVWVNDAQWNLANSIAYICISTLPNEARKCLASVLGTCLLPFLL